MGEMGVGVELEKLDASAIDLQELHRAVWGEIYAVIKRDLPDSANAFTRDAYLSNAASEGLGRGEYSWGRSDSYLEFSYSGDGDVLTSRSAALHWVDFAYRVRFASIATSFGGWRLTSPGSVGKDLVLGPRYPLFYLRDEQAELYDRPVAGKPIDMDRHVASTNDNRWSWAELTKRERAIVDWTALTGHCQCELCDAHRAPWIGGRWEYDRTKLLPIVRAAWELLEGGGQAELEAQAAKAVRDATWETPEQVPPELTVLSDWLGGNNATLPPDVLAGLVTTHARR